jgi:hypothetical protein
MFSNRKIILIILLLLTVCLAAYLLLVVIPSRVASNTYEGAKQIGADIREALQLTPTITVNNMIVLQQEAAVLELATASQQFNHRYTWTNKWMGSTKKVQIEGSFTAKAGFDLQHRFSIDIKNDEAIVTLPEPKLLSITLENDVTFRDEHGVWNWVNAEDRNAAINAFTSDAKRFAQQGRVVEKARESLEKQLTDILSAHGKSVTIRYVAAERIAPL